MPDPTQERVHARLPMHSELFKKMWEQEPPNLAEEIRELRKEILQLRADLAPMPSVILTGQAVLEEFKRIRK